MLDNFLNQTCDIVQVVKTLSGGEETKTETPVYTSIPCYYYSSKQVLDETGLASNTDLSGYKVMLQGNKTLVRPEMLISITDPDLGLIGKFIITGVKVNRLINGSKDSIELVIKKI